MPTYPDPAVLYPEVVAAGSLAAALAAAAAGQGLTVAVPVAAGSLYSASVPSAVGHRKALEVSASRVKRNWYISGCEPFEDAALIGGETSDLAQLARAAQAWHDGVPLAGIVVAAPFVELTGGFEVPDGDPALMAGSQWQGLRADARKRAVEWDWPEYLALVEAAYAEPQLRRLYPFTTHYALRFSTRTRPMLSRLPLPRLHAARGSKYWVTMDYREDDEDAVLGKAATAQDAVALAVRHLPPDLGPVTSGKPPED